MKLFSQIFIMVFAALLAMMLLSSCYTKQQCIEKVCRTDTVRAEILVHDTVIIDRITTDTVFSTEVDTVTLVKDKLVIQYKKVAGKVYLSGQYKGDTIYREKLVKVALPCNCPPCDKSWRDNLIYLLYGFMAGVLLMFLYKR